MKKHIRLVLVAATVCCLPILFLSPLLFGAGNECNEYAKNIPCNYSLGCKLQIVYCSNSDEADCDYTARESSIQVNLFSCSPSTNNNSCDPVTDSNGLVTAPCVKFYDCNWDPVHEVCYAYENISTCNAPLWKTTPCP